MPFESNQSGRSNPGRGRKGRGERDSFLSPDLEALAEQLSQDSQWLALNYPAHKPRKLRQPRRFQWVAVAAVAALVLLAIDGWRLWNRPAPQNPVREGMAVLPVPSSAIQSASSVPLSTPAIMETRVPGVMFKDLNGAEKEAVLDFLEERAPAFPSTSLPL